MNVKQQQKNDEMQVCRNRMKTTNAVKLFQSSRRKML